MVCSEGENFEGDSWTAQCEILQATLLGGDPLGEDEPPNGPDAVQPMLYELFGFGQPGQGPHQQGPHQQDDDNNANKPGNNNEGNNEANQPMDAEGWGSLA